MKVCVCTFKRTITSPQEYGVAIMKDAEDLIIGGQAKSTMIVDKDCKPVIDAYDCDLDFHRGCFTFQENTTWQKD